MNRSLTLKNKQEIVLNSEIELGESEGKGKGRFFTSRFLEPGIAHYEELGDILITKETLNKFVHTMVGAPVIIDHEDVTDKNVDKLRVGVISRVWFNEFDGWFYCEGILTDNEAIDLIKNQGWNVSCAYSFESIPKDMHNGKKIDLEFVDGEFLHLAIVKNPRYEGANIVVNKKDDEKGKWITVRGTHVFIPDGKSVDEVIEKKFRGTERDEAKKDVDLLKQIHKSREDYANLEGKYSKEDADFDEEQAKKDIEMVKKFGHEDIDSIADYLGLDPDEVIALTGEGYEDEEERDKSGDSGEKGDKQSASEQYRQLQEESAALYKSPGRHETKAEKKARLDKWRETQRKLDSLRKDVYKEFQSTDEPLMGSISKERIDKESCLKEMYGKKFVDHRGLECKVVGFSGKGYRGGYMVDYIAQDGDKGVDDNYMDSIKTGVEHFGSTKKVDPDNKFWAGSFNNPHEGKSFDTYEEAQKYQDKIDPMYAVKEKDAKGYFVRYLPRSKKANNSIGDITMQVLNELKEFIKNVVSNEKDDEMKEVKNEDKRKLIDEVGGILKGKVDDEIIRTVIKKAEELSYEPSEDSKADNEDDDKEKEAKNKCKNEDDEKEEEIEEKVTENEDKEEDKKEDKEDKAENKKVKNSMKDIVMGGSSQAQTQKLYTSRKERLEEGNKY